MFTRLAGRHAPQFNRFLHVFGSHEEFKVSREKEVKGLSNQFVFIPWRPQACAQNVFGTHPFVFGGLSSRSQSGWPDVFPPDMQRALLNKKKKNPTGLAEEFAVSKLEHGADFFPLGSWKADFFRSYTAVQLHVCCRSALLHMQLFPTLNQRPSAIHICHSRKTCCNILILCLQSIFE